MVKNEGENFEPRFESQNFDLVSNSFNSNINAAAVGATAVAAASSVGTAAYSAANGGAR